MHWTLLVALLLAGLACAAAAADPQDKYNVVWDSPSKDTNGTMPIGNGEIGLNVWVEPGGDLLFYISRTDAWDESARLLKLGRVRVKLTPNPLANGAAFRQELRLRQGEIAITVGGVKLRVWVDANHPVIHVEGEGREPFEARAALEVWRTADRTLSPEEGTGMDTFSKDAPPFVTADTVLQNEKDRVIWYHRNGKSVWPVTLEHQGLGDLIPKQTDPLLNRTFGGMMTGEGMVGDGAMALKSAKPGRSFSVSITTQTAQTTTADEWVKQLAAIPATPIQQAHRAHEKWWSDFWNRSWIRVTASRGKTTLGAKIGTNHLPLRIGADSNGTSDFHGTIGRVAVYDRVLAAGELAGLASAKLPPKGCVGKWDFTDMSDLKRNGVMSLVDGPVGKAVRLNGSAYLDASDRDVLNQTDAITVEAWVKPDSAGGEGGRIVDKIPAGTTEGYLLDLHPGYSPRFIAGDSMLTCDDSLPPDKWSHIAATYDAKSGEKRLFVNGKLVASSGKANRRPEEMVVSQGYALQRFIAACGGRGHYPIKFNGSIFTVDLLGRFDADFRQWGGCYWFQNTRLPYWPMAAQGDFEMMRPLFKMYLDALPVAEERAKVSYGHEGACFPDTIHFWGACHNGPYGFGWDREGKHVGVPDNGYIGQYWQGGIELIAIMLDYYAYTQDADFVKSTIVPFATQIMTFYHQHYKRGPDGKILFDHAQALETWWDCVNPLPDIAGLWSVLPRLLDLPGVDATLQAQWKRMYGELPKLPMRRVPGRGLLAAAEKMGPHQNCENPELYAIFPYRLFCVGKGDISLAWQTFDARLEKMNWGWTQDDIQAAFLGLTDEARRMVVGRFGNKNADSRFPAFWGPNFDWIPDQDHGSNALTALQTMLMQCDGKKILLLPAWPKDWDVEFKLHAPYQTTVQGVYRDGKLESLKVTPASRAKDVEVR